MFSKEELHNILIFLGRVPTNGLQEAEALVMTSQKVAAEFKKLNEEENK